jgi:prevent-host-death family protein
MPAQIPHRELRNNSAAVLRRVQAGETIEVTNHGEVVAVLVPPQRQPGQLRVRPALRHGGFSELRPEPADESTQAILDELRGDR